MSRGRSASYLLISAVLWAGVGCAATLLWLQPVQADISAQVDEVQDALQTLELSADQQQEVGRVVLDYRQQVLTLHDSFWKDVGEAELDADRNIAAILNPDQSERYSQLILGEG